MTLKSAKADLARKGVRFGWGRSKWIHLDTYGVHRLYLKKDTNQIVSRFIYRIYILHGIVIQLVHVQHISKGGAKHVHDVMLFVERRNPRANVVHLVIGRNAILGKGDELVIIVMMHVVIRHLVLAEI